MKLKYAFFIVLSWLSLQAANAVDYVIGDNVSVNDIIPIGDNASSSSNEVPYDNYYKYSTVQMLYTPSEIGRSGKITSIAFKVATASSFATSEVNVYLGHKSGTFSGASNYVSSSNLTQVYSGSPTLGGSTGWETITFNKGSFNYNGTDNLVVVVTRKSSSYNSSLKYSYFTSSSGTYTLLRGSDSNSNYGNVTNTSSYATSTNRASIRFGMVIRMPISADTDYTTNGVTYTLHTNATATVKALTLSWREVVIPITVSYEGTSFSVTEVGPSVFAVNNYSVTLPSTITTINNDAFNNSRALAIIWNSNVKLTTSHINKMKALSPNVLIYVNSSGQLYTTGLQDSTNVVVNTTARKVVLKDGYDFYCPKQFYANSISYTRNFKMSSGINGSSAGWETIALPFSVETISHKTKGKLIPFYSYSSIGSEKPFWLYSWGSSGWTKASGIRYNTPYLICMPNNEYYHTDYNLGGEITFSSAYAYVYKSAINRTDYSSSTYSSRQFYPSFVAIDNNNYIYNINVGSISSETGNLTPGSAFIRNLRNVKPFEGYLFSSTSNAPMFAISLFDDSETTGILDLMKNTNHKNEVIVYDMKGLLVVKTKVDNIEDVLVKLPEGIYIVNGKKMIVKR